MAEKIKIKIAGRMYPLTVNGEDETHIRKAGLRIEKMIKNFEENYAINDKQDALAMCLLQMASNLEKEKQKNEETISTITEQLREMNELAETTKK